jgi:hypothetical protein
MSKQPKKQPVKKPAVVKKQESKNPNFEAELDKAAAGQVQQQPADQPGIEQQPKKDNRGGARPGAGRPMGVSDDMALVNRLPQKANVMLVPVLRIPFELWSIANNMPELELTKEEGEDLALPVTQLLEYYFPGKIPEIAWVWLMMCGATYNVMKPRMALIQARKQQSASVARAGQPASSPSEPAGSGPKNPGTGYPKQ